MGERAHRGSEDDEREAPFEVEAPKGAHADPRERPSREEELRGEETLPQRVFRRRLERLEAASGRAVRVKVGHRDVFCAR
jgi:hypothetical protein